MQSITLERLQRCVSRAISADTCADMYHVDSFMSMMAREIIVTIRRDVYAQRIDVANTRHPLDWKEAVKERWAPKWVLRRWPVRYAEFDVTAYHAYPNIAIHGQKAVLWVESIPRDGEDT